MKDKEKQIQEMAKHGCYDGCASGLRKFCDEYDGKPCKNMVRIASGLYNAGYRQVPDGAVVLTKEDLKHYAKDCFIGELAGYDILNGLIERAKRKEAEARKETAKEILDLIAKIIKEEYGGEPPCNFNCNDEYMFDNCNEFCCEYCNTPDNEKNYERCWIEFFKSKMKKYGVEVEK